ncbi:MAG: primosomal protein N' [Kiloniellales bacterium]|nr:primosomal protein N' [Kiloniellales bacterium]
MPERHASSAAAVLPGLQEGPESTRLSVLLPLPLVGTYDYLAPSGETLEPGRIVQAPLGNREIVGVVWDDPAGADPLPPAKLKAIGCSLDLPPLPAAERRFVEWMADYTVTPPGAVLKLCLSVRDAFLPSRPIQAVRPAADPEALGLRLTPARRRVLAELAAGPARPAAEVARAAGVSASVVKGLLGAGALEPVELPPPPPFQRPDPGRPGPALTASQSEAAAALRGKVAAGGFSVTLLDGVTGAGKTEVYLEALAEALRAGRQVLVLLPEIALSAAWLERFQARFGVLPAVWHSDLTAAERRLTWRSVALGAAPVVVGARSALFLPYPELGLIVVDEEHDPAFKQEDGVVYQARDMAVVRGRLGAHPVVLVSATPSLETVVNVERGRYEELELPERHGAAGLPEVTLVDLRRDRPPRIQGLGQSWLSEALRRGVREALEAGEQALLFLNRRGYAPLTLCRSCGHRLDCPNCTAWLVEHRLAGRLQCHHCGHVLTLPKLCPACQAEDSLAACGPGVERLAEEVAALFPEARTALLSSDTLTGPAAAAELLRQVRDRELDLLIGTQVVAKGHHFPYLTLVGVVDADLGLMGGDLRAGERTFQLLHQVAGRAGRAERPGRVLLQTTQPEHPVMQALVSGDRDRFLETEAEQRRQAGMPPFTRLAALILSGPDPELVERAARELARCAPRGEGLQVLGPAPAPLAILRGLHRRRFLVRARRAVKLQDQLRAWTAQVKLPSSLRLKIDVDPYSFL